MTDTSQPPTAAALPSRQRRRLLTASAASAASVAGFFGPWSVHRAWAQAAQAKPLVIGLTMDLSLIHI